MLIWTDVETNGLGRPEDGHLLELALVVTDDDLVEQDYFHAPLLPVGVSIDDVPMDDFVRQMHTKNGLIADIKTHGLRRHEAEASMVAFLQKVFEEVPPVPSHVCANCEQNEKEHVLIDFGLAYNKRMQCPTRKEADFMPLMLSALSQTPLAGSNISFDAAWIKEHMPILSSLYHYRSVDVSTITELAKRWSPAVYKDRPKAEKGAAHRALADALESIAYLRYYKKMFVGTPILPDAAAIASITRPKFCPRHGAADRPVEIPGLRCDCGVA